MICDDLGHAHRYGALCPGLGRALAWLAAADRERLAPGVLELDGPALQVRIAEYSTRPAQDVPFEAHRRFIDVQYLAAGCEQIGFAPLARLRETQGYDAERDVAFFAAPAGASPPCGTLTLVPGRFAIFFPQDAHQPGVALGPPSAVRKVVVKVAVPE